MNYYPGHVLFVIYKFTVIKIKYARITTKYENILLEGAF